MKASLELSHGCSDIPSSRDDCFAMVLPTFHSVSMSSSMLGSLVSQSSIFQNEFEARRSTKP